MKRLIDLQTALDLLEKDIAENGEAPESDYNLGINHARAVISGITSAQPERKRGKWVDNDGSYVCDQCGEPCASEIMGKPRDRFCKWCGARMDGGGPLATAYRKEGDE